MVNGDTLVLSWSEMASVDRRTNEEGSPVKGGETRGSGILLLSFLQPLMTPSDTAYSWIAAAALPYHYYRPYYYYHYYYYYYYYYYYLTCCGLGDVEHGLELDISQGDRKCLACLHHHLQVEGTGDDCL